LASQLQINYSTTRSIIYKYKKTGSIGNGKRGGKKKHIIKEEISNKLLEYLEAKPDSTLSELKNFLQVQFNLTCSISTINRFLVGNFYSIKKVYGSVEEKNSERVKTLRMKYVENFQEKQWRSSQCIYIDEIGFNAWMRRTRGRSKIGTRINAIHPNSRGRNMSLIMVISKRGPVHHKIVMGGVTRSIYQDFLIELDGKLPPTEHYLIQDNASVHKNVTSRNNLQYLPPYSPFLNPIETVFSKLKSIVRSKLSRMKDFLHTSNAQRMALLSNIIVDTIESGEFSNLMEYYHHIEIFFPSSILKKDIFGD